MRKTENGTLHINQVIEWLLACPGYFQIIFNNQNQEEEITAAAIRNVIFEQIQENENEFAIFTLLNNRHLPTVKTALFSALLKMIGEHWGEIEYEQFLQYALVYLD